MVKIYLFNFRLVKKYGNHETFALQIRMLKSLAFVPAEEVAQYFESFEKKYVDDDVKKICQWFKKNYVGQDGRHARYLPQFWTVDNSSSSRTENFPRTQNNVEAWHRRLKVVVGRSHAGLYKLIGDLQKELILAKHQVSRKQNGEKIRKKLQTIRRNKQLKRIVRERENLSHIAFLKRLAKNLLLH